MWLLLSACRPVPAPVPVPPVEPEPEPAVAPVPVDLRIVGLALGESTTCIRRSDGRVACRGARNVPWTLLEGELDVTDVAVCARAGGTIRCLRDGSEQQRDTPFLEVVIGSGGAACGRDPAGAVWCWRGAEEDGAVLEPVALPAPARRLVGAAETFALLDDGRLAAFDPYAVMSGRGEPRVVADEVLELDGTLLTACWRTAGSVTCQTLSGRPRKIRGISHPTALAVGVHGGCVVEDGVPRCWQGDQPPRRIDGVNHAVAIDGGGFHTCALLDGGALRCWGTDVLGQVSDAFPL